MHKQVFILASSQALFQTTVVIVMTIGGLAGTYISNDPFLSTFPIGTMFLGTALMMFPASMLMERVGRKNGFLCGAILGVLGGIISAMGLLLKSLLILGIGTLLIGSYQSFAQYYRFAASEVSNEVFRSKAVSFVLGGGILAAIISPTLIKISSDFFEYKYIGSFITISILSLLALTVLTYLRMPKTYKTVSDGSARKWLEIISQPAYFVALFCATSGYGIMILGMTATPIAMQHSQHNLTSITTVIQMHVLGMFLPSFFTGSLIARFGTLKIMVLGFITLLIYIAFSISGTNVLTFMLSLILLGIGWNFVFVSATVLLTGTYYPSEKSKALAINDMTIFVVGIFCAFSAGILVNSIGWQKLNLLLLIWLALSLSLIIWFKFKIKTN